MADILTDVLKAIAKIKADDGKPRPTVHHPNCAAIKHQDLYRCNCGGAAYR